MCSLFTRLNAPHCRKQRRCQYLPYTDKVDTDLLLCVANDNNNLGKAVTKVPKKSQAATKHMYLRCALMMRKTRQIVADRIHALHGNVCRCNERGADCSLRYVAGTDSRFPVATTLYDSLNVLTHF